MGNEDEKVVIFHVVGLQSVFSEWTSGSPSTGRGFFHTADEMQVSVGIIHTDTESPGNGRYLYPPSIKSILDSFCQKG